MSRDSPTRRVRTLADVGSRTRVAHVGLAHEKLAPHNSRADREAQARFIRNLVDHSDAPAGYELQFRRWVRRTPEIMDGALGRRVRVAVSQGRVLCGMGALTPTENGLSIHATYGVPYLPGSSLKGIAKAWLAERVKEGPWAADGPLLQEVFGTAAGADDDARTSGTVSFLDALWIPADPRLPAKPWAAEILTPHLGGYYQGKGPPDGTESPVPVTFLAAQGGFRLVVEGPQALLDPVIELLERALRDRGVGAKSRSGYGHFRLWEADTKTRADEQESASRDERVLAQEREDTFARASSVVEVLAALQRFEADRDLRSDVEGWLIGAEGLDRRLAAYPVTPASAAAVFGWAHEVHLSKGLMKRVREQLPPDVQAEIEARLAEPAESGGSFGPNTLATFDDPSGLSSKKAKKWPNDFAQRIASGGFDEATVRAALEHLRRNGGAEGHLEVIRRAYGLDTDDQA